MTPLFFTTNRTHAAAWSPLELLARVGVALTLAACGGDASTNQTYDLPASRADDADAEVPPGACVDLDGDGYGAGCELGPDCDDDDDAQFDTCDCAGRIDEGCGCALGTEPVACQLPPALVEASTVLCKTGMRYCRDGVWTECVGIAHFEQ